MEKTETTKPIIKAKNWPARIFRGQIYPAVVKDTRNGNLKKRRADGKAIKSKERRL